MANFPQSFEPVNSDSILEQFLQLKNNVNRVNTGMVNVEQTADSAFEKSSNNESSIQVLENDVQTLSTGLETAEQNLSKCVRFDVQSLTDAQKAQARSNIGASASAESSTTVLVNGVAQTQIQFDSDPQTQIDSTKSEISALNSRVETAESEISALDGKALKTPMTAPAENEIPTINTANAQVNVTVGNGLKIETNELKVDNNIIQDKLTAGNGISIANGVISATSKAEILWTNPNLSSALETATINLSSSDYDFLIINYEYSAYNQDELYSVIVPKGKSVILHTMHTGGYYNAPNDSILEINRTLTFVSDTQYTTTTPSYINWLGGTNLYTRTSSNDTNIPTSIIGVKI